MKIDTSDKVLTYVGNNKIFSDNIQNFSANSYRRVDLVAQLNYSADPQAVIQFLKEGLSKIQYVLPTPVPEVEILQFTPAGPVLAVRPYCHTDHYWQVYFASNQLIHEAFGNAGYPVSQPHFAFHNAPQAQEAG